MKAYLNKKTLLIVSLLIIVSLATLERARGSYMSWASTQDILPKKILRSLGDAPYANGSITVLLTVPMSTQEGSYTVPLSVSGSDASSGQLFSFNAYIQVSVSSVYQPQEEISYWVLALVSAPTLLIFIIIIRRKR